jgi:hypothetical protein
MCTVLLPPGANPIAVNKYINININLHGRCTSWSLGSNLNQTKCGNLKDMLNLLIRNQPDALIQTNQPTRCINLSDLLLVVHIQLNMFRASTCPPTTTKTLLPPRSNGKPEAATAVYKLLMIGKRIPETCWAVFKRRAINLRNCCIWLVDLFECMMMHRLTNPKFRCTNFSNLFWKETLHVWNISSVHHQTFFTVHAAMVYVTQVCWQPASGIRMEHPDPASLFYSAFFSISYLSTYLKQLMIYLRHICDLRVISTVNRQAYAGWPLGEKIVWLAGRHVTSYSRTIHFQ